MIKRHRRTTPPIERFRKKVMVDADSGCHIWTGTKVGNGYGHFKVSSQTLKLAHRWIYEYTTGQTIPEGLCACHKCDNPSCVNPDHLFIGTRMDNIQDCISKGRNRRSWRGPFAKLSEIQAQVIREAIEAGFKISEIANYFKVAVQTIYAIRDGRTWRKYKKLVKNESYTRKGA